MPLKWVNNKQRNIKADNTNMNFVEIRTVGIIETSRKIHNHFPHKLRVEGIHIHNRQWWINSIISKQAVVWSDITFSSAIRHWSTYFQCWTFSLLWNEMPSMGIKGKEGHKTIKLFQNRIKFERWVIWPEACIVYVLGMLPNSHIS